MVNEFYSNNFPREVGPPRKIVRNKDEMIKFINLYNGRKNAIYVSVYGFLDDINMNYESAVVDCLFFDFDDKECDAYNEVKKLHNYCLQNNIKHKLVMSGRGYHCYISTNSYKPSYTKSTIYNSQHFFIDLLNLNLDRHVVGNPAQLARAPNTYNKRANKFCIPITKEQFDKGDTYVKELAIKQNFIDNVYICENEFNITKYDYETKMFNDSEMINNSIDSNIENLNINFPPCLINIIKNGNMKWKERYLLILFLKENGYTMQNVYDILSEICNTNKLNHCVNEEKQLQYLFNRDDLFFPSCNKIKMDGYCIGKCKYYNKLIYK